MTGALVRHKTMKKAGLCVVVVAHAREGARRNCRFDKNFSMGPP
jgi:hypothetical protein